jgi:tetratricopeptide (TPR) repeat protein
MRLARYLWPLAVLLLLLAGCSKEGRIQSHLEKGKALFAQGDLDKAGVEIRNVLQLEPKQVEGWLMSGRIFEERNDLRSAVGNYLKVLELDPANLDAKRRLARIYLLGGAPDRAADTAAAVLAAVPDDPDARAIKAALRAQRGEVDEAIADALAVLQKQPGHADAAALLAGLYSSRKNDDAKAAEVLTGAMSANPKNIPIRSLHASLAMKLGQQDAAERDLKEIVAIDPKTFQYRLALARFYVATKHAEPAEKVLREAVDAAPDDEQRHLALVELINSQKGASAAEAELRKAIEAHPKAYKLRFALASGLEANRKPDEARKIYDEVVQADKTGPSAQAAKLQLARMAFAGGKTADGDTLLGEILQANPKDEGALVMRGQRSLAKNDAPGAIADLRAALKNDPGSMQINGLLAAAHRQNKEVELGRQVIASAVDLYPDRTDLRLLLADYDLRSNAPDEAMKSLDEAIRRQPRDPSAYLAKARLQAARKDSAGAQRTLAALKEAAPDAPVGYFQSGMLFGSEDKTEQAVKELQTAIRKAPNAVEPRLALVSLLVREKRFDQAASAAQEAVDAYPNSYLARVLLGEVQVAQGKLDLAEASYRKAIELDAKAPLPRINLAKLQLAARKDAPKAIATLEEAKAALPDSREVGQMLAQLYMQTGRAPQAIAQYEALLKANPADDVAANNLVMLLVADNPDKARLDRAQALTQRFENSGQPAFLDTAGWVHYLRGDYEKALPLLQKAVSLAPSAAELQYHVGMALYKTGKVDQAKQHLKQALEAKVEFPGLEEARKIMAQG